jgi:hypothetical protein
MKKKIILGVVAVVVLAIIGTGVWLYAGKFNETKAKTFKKLALPVAMVGNQAVNGREFLTRVELAQTLYKDDPTFKIGDVQSQILDQLVEDAKLHNIAAQHSITASQGEIDAEFKGVVDQFAGGDESKLGELLDQSYHLNAQDFKNKVLASDILRTNLTVWFNSQKDLNQAAYAQKDKLMTMLDQGQPFEDVVKVYTQDEATKDFGGDTGFVKIAELAPEFKQPLANAKAGDRILVVSRYGLHIIRVVEVDSSGSEPSYHLQQLFIQETGFDDWYNKQADSIKARKLIKF